MKGVALQRLFVPEDRYKVELPSVLAVPAHTAMVGIVQHFLTIPFQLFVSKTQTSTLMWESRRVLSTSGNRIWSVSKTRFLNVYLHSSL